MSTGKKENIMIWIKIPVAQNAFLVRLAAKRLCSKPAVIRQIIQESRKRCRQ